LLHYSLLFVTFILSICCRIHVVNYISCIAHVIIINTASAKASSIIVVDSCSSLLNNVILLVCLHIYYPTIVVFAL